MDKQLKDHFLSQQLTTSSTDIIMLQTHFYEEISAAYVDFMKTYGDVLFESPLPNSVLVNIATKKLIAGMVGFFTS